VKNSLAAFTFWEGKRTERKGEQRGEKKGRGPSLVSTQGERRTCCASSGSTWVVPWKTEGKGERKEKKKRERGKKSRGRKANQGFSGKGELATKIACLIPRGEGEKGGKGLGVDEFGSRGKEQAVPAIN